MVIRLRPSATPVPSPYARSTTRSSPRDPQLTSTPFSNRPHSLHRSPLERAGHGVRGNNTPVLFSRHSDPVTRLPRPSAAVSTATLTLDSVSSFRATRMCLRAGKPVGRKRLRCLPASPAPYAPLTGSVFRPDATTRARRRRLSAGSGWKSRSTPNSTIGSRTHFNEKNH